MININKGYELRPEPEGEPSGELAEKVIRFIGDLELLSRKVEGYKIIKSEAATFLKKANDLDSYKNSVGVEREKLQSFITEMDLLYDSDRVLDGFIKEMSTASADESNVDNLLEGVAVQISSIDVSTEELMSHAKTLMQKILSNYSNSGLDKEFELFL